MNYFMNSELVGAFKNKHLYEAEEEVMTIDFISGIFFPIKCLD